MKIWAIGDLHLSFGVPNKGMEIFGTQWENHGAKIQERWESLVAEEDLVLLPGDISWGLKLEEAKVDLDWIGELPGKKILIRGNHDYWWGSLSKVKKILPPSIEVIQNNAAFVEGISIAGARLWDTPEYSFSKWVNLQPKDKETEEKVQEESSEKIFLRELERLRLSLQAMNQEASCKIVMTHYPPIGPDLAPSRASQLLEEYGVDICLFGHLHSLKRGFSEKIRGVQYHLCSADMIDFTPIRVL